MKFAALVTAAALVGNSAADNSKGHPIERVIKLIKDLKEKAVAEGKDEAVSYGKFEYWCKTSKSDLSDAIADEKEKIEELESKLDGLNKVKASLEKEIEELEEQLSANEAAAKKAKDIRKDEASNYSDANSDLKKTIKAVQECIKALKGAEGKTESFVQLLSLVSHKVSDKQRLVLEHFARPDQLAEGDLEAHVDKYDFKSENVIELLKELKQKFEDDKLAGTKAETAAINAYDLAKEASDNAHDAASKSKKQKETELGTTKADIADAEKNLKSTQDDLEADSATLEQTSKDCRIKKSEWEERSNTRTLEIEAMDQAVKILGKSTGVRTEAPSNPIPPASPAMFLQVADSTDPKMKAVALIKEAAQSGHSRALQALAVEVAAHLNGPFDQVNNMIEKMIFRLMDEQKQEDEHKHWCDQELEKTNTMKDNHEDHIADLKAEIEVETGKISELTEEIADANKMISDIIAFIKEATEIRNTGKKENAVAIKDSEDAQTSLSDAIAVLKDFYKDSGEIAKEPWEFLQEPVKLPKNPKTWDSGYTGVSDPDKQPGGIITILETVNSDFAKMEAETRSQEAQDQSEFEESIQKNNIEKAERTQEVKMKTSEKARRADKVASLSSKKKSAEGELEKTNQYLTDLKPACVNGDSKYEDRVAARAKEIEALKKAQVTLMDAFKEKKSFLQLRGARPGENGGSTR